MIKNSCADHLLEFSYKIALEVKEAKTWKTITFHFKKSFIAYTFI
jgi:hypothetical protein